MAGRMPLKQEMFQNNDQQKSVPIDKEVQIKLSQMDLYHMLREPLVGNFGEYQNNMLHTVGVVKLELDRLQIVKSRTLVSIRHIVPIVSIQDDTSLGWVDITLKIQNTGNLIVKQQASVVVQAERQANSKPLKKQVSTQTQNVEELYKRLLTRKLQEVKEKNLVEKAQPKTQKNQRREKLKDVIKQKLKNGSCDFEPVLVMKQQEQPKVVTQKFKKQPTFDNKIIEVSSEQSETNSNISDKIADPGDTSSLASYELASSITSKLQLSSTTSVLPSTQRITNTGVRKFRTATTSSVASVDQYSLHRSQSLKETISSYNSLVRDALVSDESEYSTQGHETNPYPDDFEESQSNLFISEAASLQLGKKDLEDRLSYSNTSKPIISDVNISTLIMDSETYK